MPVSLRGYGGARRQRLREHDTASGWIHLHCYNPAMNLHTQLGPELPQITGGFGGWEVTERPRAVGMTTWTGVPPFELSLNILLYTSADLSESVGVEAKIRGLIDVARGTEDHTPGIVRIDGIPGLPADRWVITNIDWGDAVRGREEMHRIRQLATLTLLEYQPPHYERLRGRSLKRPRAKTVGYTVKHGDTPVKIAKRHHCKWTDIRAVNKRGVIKSANQNLRDGMRINVPVKHPHHKKKRGKGKH
jgi:hypothetical protein